MKVFFQIVIAALSLPAVIAEPSVRVDVPEPTAWVGQRLPVYIELRADGSFTSAASFDVPEIPGTILVKMGGPVISSEAADGGETIIQRHEFALFSQRDGELVMPSITARFSSRNGFTGPSSDVEVSTEPFILKLNRPSGSEGIGFLVTGKDLMIDEAWDPEPGPVKVGAVFKRTITQSAEEVTGMAFAPAPDRAPEGIRVYSGTPAVNDKIQRGQLSGERKETLTYLVQQAGTFTLPEIRYDWWDPVAEKLESRVLPEVTFTATAPPPPPTPPSPLRFLWIVVPFAISGCVYVWRRPLLEGFRRFHGLVDPPRNRAARAFLKACRNNDAASATRTWAAWSRYYPSFTPESELADALSSLHRRVYGNPSTPAGKWSGTSLAVAFEADRPRRESEGHPHVLPSLNP